MPVSKLSQIASAVNVQPSDTIVGVQQGAIDALYMINQVGFVPTFSNINFYVSTTGSDSNPGTQAQPFATIQHALVVSSYYNYQGLYFPTINVGPGTFSILSSIVLTVLRSSVQGSSVGTQAIILGSGISTTKILDVNGFGCIYGPTETVWQVSALTLDSDVAGLVANGGVILVPFNGTIGFANTSGFSDNPTCVMATNGGLVQLDAVINININDINCGPLVRASGVAFVGQPGGTVLIDNSTLNLPSSNMTHSTGFWFIDTFQINNMSVQFYLMNINHGASWLGNQVRLGGAGIQTFITDDGTFSRVPGVSTGNDISGGVIVSGTNSDSGSAGQSRLSGNLFSGLPTTSNLAPGQWAVFKDTSGGTVNLAYNDAGTIKKVALT